MVVIIYGSNNFKANGISSPLFKIKSYYRIIVRKNIEKIFSWLNLNNGFENWNFLFITDSLKFNVR